MGQLGSMAFFFAMRACEYVETSGSTRTKVIVLGDIAFRRGGKLIDSHKSSELVNAETVSNTYRTQKNGERGTTVTQHRTDTSKAKICPIRALSGLVERVANYKIESGSWKDVASRPVNLIIKDNHRKPTLITANDIKHHIRAAAFVFGEDRLGFTVSRLGTHSIRSGAATAMFLAGVPAETIQLIGWWCSQAFLRYIRIEVQQLTRGVSTFMTLNPEFYTIGNQIG